MAVCDLCSGLDRPRCVEVCPFEALSYKPLGHAGSTPGKQAFKRVLEELV